MTSYADCTHENTVIRKKLMQNGAYQARTQCKDCGHYGRGGIQAVPHSLVRKRGIDAVDQLPEFDDVAFARAERQKRAFERDQAKADRDRAEMELRRQGREERRAYYDSAAWQDKRIKVMRRAANICEGCASAPATQVHHVSYEHFGAELLWELRAVCDDCHNRIHAPEKEREAKVLGSQKIDQKFRSKWT